MKGGTNRHGVRALANEQEKPAYRVTGRVNGDRKRWTPIGAGWNSISRQGVPYISVKLDAIPLNWDGVMALHEILGEDKDPALPE